MKKILILLLLIISTWPVFSQAPPKPYGKLPSQRQLSWQETDMYCIITLSMATYADKEWAYGDDNPSVYNPFLFNAMQIIGAAKSGGFKGVVIVAKHHDGFCIWPTKTTAYNISKSPWKNGKGDLIKEYQLACQKLHMKFGIYCSPWDRNNALYGKPEYVTQIYRKQLEELYANYGPLFMSWHDGANGGDGYYGGAKEIRKIDRSTYYGWDTTFAITRKMQPGASIFGDVGPDVRWVGNEEGHAGETSWETYTPHSTEPGKTPANGLAKYWEGVEGTRNGDYWMPAECDVPLRPGWIYHPAEDGQTKSAYDLLSLYYKSVGRGACLDIGLSPNQRGQITAEDVNALKQFKLLMQKTFSANLAKGATFTASNVRGNSPEKYGTKFLIDNDRYSYWATDDSVTKPQLLIDMHTPKTFNVIRIRENIKLGQRIAAAAVDAYQNGGWKEIATVSSIGANRLIRLPENITSAKIRLRIISSPVCIAVSDFGIFKEPVHLTLPDINRDKQGNISISTEAPVGSVHYTVDGTMPTLKSPVYKKPFLFTDGGVVKAISFDGAQYSSVRSRVFGYSKTEWKIFDMSPHTLKEAESAIDEDPGTLFNTSTKDDTALVEPQVIDVDMGKVNRITSFTYLPRQDKTVNGIVDRYAFFISDNGSQWREAANGEFSNIRSNPIEQVVKLGQPVTARYFRFVAKHVVKGNGFAIAELGIQ